MEGKNNSEGIWTDQKYVFVHLQTFHTIKFYGCNVRSILVWKTTNCLMSCMYFCLCLYASIQLYMWKTKNLDIVPVHQLNLLLLLWIPGLEITFSNQTLSDQYMKNLNESVFIQKICLVIMKGLHWSKRYEGKFNVTCTHFYLTIIVLIRHSGSTILLYYFEPWNTQLCYMNREIHHW